MTPTQLAAAYANGSHDEQADFNDNLEEKVYPSGGSGTSDGMTWSGIHENYDSEEKAAFEAALITHGFSVKGPC